MPLCPHPPENSHSRGLKPCKTFVANKYSYLNNWNFFLCYQDSLLDIVTSLGADEGKIVLTATAFANKFTLLDAERNLPGAAAVGKPETITYQQVGAKTTELDNQKGFNCRSLVVFMYENYLPPTDIHREQNKSFVMGSIIHI